MWAVYDKITGREQLNNFNQSVTEKVFEKLLRRIRNHLKTHWLKYIITPILYFGLLAYLMNYNPDNFNRTISGVTYRLGEHSSVVGYCISTVVNNTGEIESIHVEKSKRGCGIGETLVKIHLQWMNNMKCERVGVTVSQENVSTIGFYKKKFGFYPNTLYMQQIK